MFEDATGRAAVTVYSRSLLRVELGGELEEAGGLWLGKTLKQQLPSMRAIVTFWDLQPLVRYHPKVRTAATEALKASLPEIEAIHVYATSTIVRMGVSVANLALGGIAVTHANRAAFEAKFKAAAST